jgi:hypothetical protein
MAWGPSGFKLTGLNPFFSTDLPEGRKPHKAINIFNLPGISLPCICRNWHRSSIPERQIANRQGHL